MRSNTVWSNYVDAEPLISSMEEFHGPCHDQRTEGHTELSL